VERGEMFTVTAHRLPHGADCGGGWHCRITGDERDGKVPVQQMKPDGDQWRPSMSTLVYVAALRPHAVQVDLFGNPAPPDASQRRPARRTIAA
jgi:hypothetical protein